MIRKEAVAAHFKSWTEESQKKQQTDKMIQGPSSTSDTPQSDAGLLIARLRSLGF